jgi:hypothetical protein
VIRSPAAGESREQGVIKESAGSGGEIDLRRLFNGNRNPFLMGQSEASQQPSPEARAEGQLQRNEIGFPSSSSYDPNLNENLVISHLLGQQEVTGAI